MVDVQVYIDQANEQQNNIKYLILNGETLLQSPGKPVHKDSSTGNTDRKKAWM